MILYNLRCERDHVFEGWFRNGAAFDRQARSGAVACPLCGSVKVEKALMAPRIGRGRPAAVDGPAPGEPPGGGPAPVAAEAELDEVKAKQAAALRALRQARKLIEENCDYVGDRFAEEARRIHYGEVERHGIYGESSADEAKALAEEGIEVGRLPWVPLADG